MQLVGLRIIKNGLKPLSEQLQQRHDQFRSSPIQDGLRLVGESRRLGAIKINHIFWFVIPILLITPLYSYNMAVSKKEQKPFPHATITATSCFYPQDITFRWGMLPFAAFINLAYYVIFRFLIAEKKRIGYPGDILGWLQPLGHASVLGFLAAIGTIDGDGTGAIHGVGAVFFFVVLFVIAVSVTMVIRDMFDWDTTVISHSSNLIKSVLTVYVCICAVYCIIGSLTQKQENDDDPYLVIIEWNLTYTCLIWLLSFVLEFKNISLTLKGNLADAIAHTN